jgi:xanthine dehydrogenase large subunit
MNAKDISVSRDAVADPEVNAANARADVVTQKDLPPEKIAAQAAGRSTAHESARAQVAGAATYVDDMPEARGTLYAAPILSTVAHGRLLGVDTAAARAMPGVRDVILASDIPGDAILGNFAHDEPVFAHGTVQHVGQVIGLVIAESVMKARRAARKVVCQIEVLPAVLDVESAPKAMCCRRCSSSAAMLPAH